MHPSVLLLHLKAFLACVVMETQHVNITGPVAWWENVTALACLCRTPLAPVFVVCILSSVFLFFIFLFIWFSKNVLFPDNPVFGLPFLELVLCCEYGAVCFYSVLFSVFLCLFLWFISWWDSCSFLNLILLCFLTLEVWMPMPYELINVYTASVPAIYSRIIHYWKD